MKTMAYLVLTVLAIAALAVTVAGSDSLVETAQAMSTNPGPPIAAGETVMTAKLADGRRVTLASQADLERMLRSGDFKEIRFEPIAAE